MAHRNDTSIKRTIRRSQLREMVPLADSTIYEMEQRGEFPRRFYLTPRCAVWDASAVEVWIEERRDLLWLVLVEMEAIRMDHSLDLLPV